MTRKEHWRSNRQDPICAYLDDFFSLPVLIAVIIGMVALLGCAAVLVHAMLTRF